MKRPSTGPTWFEDGQFLELEVSFPGPPPSRWRLEQKIYERDYSIAADKKCADANDESDGGKRNLSEHCEGDREDAGEEEGEQGVSYEACAIYICSRIDEPKLAVEAANTKEAENAKVDVEANTDTNEDADEKMDTERSPTRAIMKIRLQVPSPSTKTDSLITRAKQATTTLTALATNEIDALTDLTASKCTSTPCLLSWKQEEQDCDGGVPGGFVVYMLMEKLPGIRVDNFLRDLEREERDMLRGCFREAWLECKACGAINLDTGIRNLLWHRERMKCHILDFELYRKPTEEDVWDDSLYLAWDLARVNESDRNDMSTWEL